MPCEEIMCVDMINATVTITNELGEMLHRTVELQMLTVSKCFLRRDIKGIEYVLKIMVLGVTVACEQFRVSRMPQILSSTKRK